MIKNEQEPRAEYYKEMKFRGFYDSEKIYSEVKSRVRNQTASKTTEELNEIIDLTETKIEEAVSNIHIGKFNINPVMYDNKDESCTYCPYSQICYKRYKDYRVINTKGGSLDDSDKAN